MRVVITQNCGSSRSYSIVRIDALIASDDGIAVEVIPSLVLVN